MKEANLLSIANKLFGKDVFISEEVNTGRQIELDIAKGISVLLMIFMHTGENFGNISGTTFAAAFFMICMGFGMRYGRRTTAGDYAMRGVKLLLIGLLLNVFRYVLPMFIAYAVSGEKIFLNTFTFLFGVDIMEFAGLTFLFFALAKKFNWSDTALAVIAAAASVAGMLLRWKTTGNMYVDQLFGYIWGNDNCQTYFPFLNWILFPAFGYLFAKLYRHCADKKTLYRKLSPVCGALGIGYIASALIFSFGMFGENGYYYFLGPVDAFFVVMLVLGFFGVYYALLRFQDTWPIRTLREISKNINTVYCIHWVILGNLVFLLMDVIPENGLNIWLVLLLATAVAAVSILLARWYQKKKFLSTKPGRIVLGCILVIAAAACIIGQTKADPLDMYEEYEEYGYSETSQIIEPAEIG